MTPCAVGSGMRSWERKRTLGQKKQNMNEVWTLGNKNVFILVLYLCHVQHTNNREKPILQKFSFLRKTSFTEQVLQAERKLSKEWYFTLGKQNTYIT